MKRILLILFTFIFFAGCKKNNSINNSLPTVSTTAITSLTSSEALAGGAVTADGGNTVIVRGVCWGTTSNPSISGNHTSNGNGIGTFTSSISTLDPGTVYYLRAYATNNNGTAYGNEIRFTTPSPDIYVVGEVRNSGRIINVWKNGIATTVSTSSCNTITYPFSIFVSASDVYLAGQEVSCAGKSIAKVWKNGIATPLGIGSYNSNGSCIFIEGQDVYVGGFESNGSVEIAKIWKNGVATSLTDGTKNAGVKGIVVNDNNVYAVGYESNGIHSVAKIWKNGVPTPLTNGTYSSVANSIFIAGNDIYVGGAESSGMSSNFIAKIWKNGNATSLTDGLRNAAVHSVSIKGNDVYAAGSERGIMGDIAKMWKNGISVSLTDGSNNGSANSLFISGNDVYVAGNDVSQRSLGRIWKNGTIQSTFEADNASVFLYSIFVK